MRTKLANPTPCVIQFKLPEQERQLQTFFSVFYFSINSGALISTFITPVFRQDVKCFGDDTCYSLAFGVPALLMLIATVILVLGKNLYVMKPPQGNIITSVVGSIYVNTHECYCCIVAASFVGAGLLLLLVLIRKMLLKWSICSGSIYGTVAVAVA